MSIDSVRMADNTLDMQESNALPTEFLSHIAKFRTMSACVETIDGTKCYVYGLKPLMVGISKIPEHFANILHMTPDLGQFFVLQSTYHKGRLYRIAIADLVAKISVLGYDFSTPPEDRYDTNRFTTAPLTTAASETRRDIKGQVSRPPKKGKRKPAKLKSKKTSKKTKKGKVKLAHSSGATPAKVATGRGAPGVRDVESRWLADQERANRLAAAANLEAAKDQRRRVEATISGAARAPKKVRDVLNFFGLGGDRNRHFNK